MTYRAVLAHQRAQRWAHHPRKLAIQPRLRTAVISLLAHRWSPEQIAHSLTQRYPDEPTMRISHESIYAGLEAGTRPLSTSTAPVSSAGAAVGLPSAASHDGQRLAGVNVVYLSTTWGVIFLKHPQYTIHDLGVM